MTIDYMPPIEFFNIVGKLALICSENKCDTAQLKFEAYGQMLAVDMIFRWGDVERHE